MPHTSANCERVAAIGVKASIGSWDRSRESRLAESPDWVKVTTLLKRRPGMSLDEFRSDSLQSYAPIVSGLPGLRRHLHCHTNDGAYVFGESSFDSVEQLWFDDLESLQGALRSEYHAEQVAPALAGLTDPRYVFSITAKENWIIRADHPAL